MPLDDFQNKIDSLRYFDFGEELQVIVSDNLDKLPPFITKQLEAGKDGHGQSATIFDSTEYRPRTIAIKKEKGVGLGAVTDRVTNYMSGDFYHSLKMEMEGQVFEADSDVSYFGDIRLRSQDSLLEVDEPNRKEFAETVTLPAIKESLLQKTGFVIT
jgi:hypothetical protein